MPAWVTTLFLCAAGLSHGLPTTSSPPGTPASGEREAGDPEPLILVSTHSRIRDDICDRGQKVLLELASGCSAGSPTVDEVIHSLRLWGIDSPRRCGQCPTGIASLQLLLEGDRFVRQWPDAEDPLISPTSRGLAVRVGNGVTEAAHRDQLLAALAEAGVSLETPVELAEERGSVWEILQEALASFSLNKRGLEWTAIGFALYLPPQLSWRSSVGTVISFDDVALRLMDAPPGDGTCLGQHRMYALVVLLGADGQQKILSSETRRSVLEWLSTASRRLTDSQYPDGSWPARWDEGRPSTQDEPDPTEIRMRVTTHVLEWWALAPEEVLPAPDVIERAVRWMTSVIETWDESTVRANYNTLTHGGRALRLWMEGPCSP